MPKFEKSQRVTVPGTLAAQGVIVDVVESVPGFPVYTLRWLTQDGETQTGSCGEGDLAAAQPVLGQAFAKFIPPKRKSKAKRKR